MSIYLGIDIGGTAVKYGLVDASGRVLLHRKQPTQAAGDALREQVPRLVRELLTETHHAVGIGISTAGVVGPGGVVLHANNNLPGYTGTDWGRILQPFGLPVAVQNDVNAAALAELWRGAGQPYDSFFCLTVGTGIGGAAVLNRRLYTGRHFRAGEIGYMNIGGERPYEQLASTAALVRLGRSSLGDEAVTAEHIFAQARGGDTACEKLLETWCGFLARGIENIVYLFDPQAVLIGGGVSNEGDFLLEHLRAAMAARMPGAFLDALALQTAACGNTAGMLGAVYPLLSLHER